MAQTRRGRTLDQGLKLGLDDRWQELERTQASRDCAEEYRYPLCRPLPLRGCGRSGCVVTGVGKPLPVTPQKVRGGLKLFEAPGPRVWEVGLETEEQWRAYRVRQREHSTSGDPTGRVMPPHFRSPHPHRYWMGPGRTPLEVRFLNFVAVNIGRSDPVGETPVRLTDDGAEMDAP